MFFRVAKKIADQLFPVSPRNSNSRDRVQIPIKFKRKSTAPLRGLCIALMLSGIIGLKLTS